MKKVNVFAVVGLFFFNLIVMLGAVIATYSFLAAAWFAEIMFMMSPAILAYSYFSGQGNITSLDLVSALLFTSLSVVIFPLLKWISVQIITISKKYIELNKAAVFY